MHRAVLLRSAPFVGLVLAAMVLNGLLWVGVSWFFPQTDPVAILHYTATVGVDFIGEGTHITVLPRLGAFVVVINVVLAAALRPADQRTTWLLLAPLPLFQALLLVAFYSLWRLNH